MKQEKGHGFTKAEKVETRVVDIARYFVAHRSTVRATAKKFGMSKSTVHKDLAVRLCDINTQLANEVREVLDINLNERAQRGGNATRILYKSLKKK